MEDRMQVGEEEAKITVHVPESNRVDESRQTTPVQRGLSYELSKFLMKPDGSPYLLKSAHSYSQTSKYSRTLASNHPSS
jgi:hypothetical protein